MASGLIAFTLITPCGLEWQRERKHMWLQLWSLRAVSIDPQKLVVTMDHRCDYVRKAEDSNRRRCAEAGMPEAP